MLVTTNVFVATNIILLRRDKHSFGAAKDVFCCNKHAFVATKIILVEAPANARVGQVCGEGNTWLLLS